MTPPAGQPAWARLGAGIDGELRIRRPVSRVLCRPDEPDAAVIPLGRTLLCGSRDLPGRLGPATALPWRAKARRPYLVLLQAGLAMPLLSPGTRCALTAPFHPCLPSLRKAAAGGLLSVALSLGSRPAGVTRRLVAVEPGLSSTLLGRSFGGPRPPGRLIRGEHGPGPEPGQHPAKSSPWGGTVAIWMRSGVESHCRLSRGGAGGATDEAA